MPSWEGPLRCIGRDVQERTFYFRLKVDEPFHAKYQIRVYASSGCADEKYAEFAGEDFDEESVIMILMKNHGGQAYSARGIPEAVIRLLGERTGKYIRSSSNKNARSAEEMRTVDATKVWQRLERLGDATYCERGDFFIHVPISPTGQHLS